MTEVRRMSMAEMYRLARSGVDKIDLLGERGTTRVTGDELEAMALLLICTDALPSAAEIARHFDLDKEKNNA